MNRPSERTGTIPSFLGTGLGGLPDDSSVQLKSFRVDVSTRYGSQRVTGHIGGHGPLLVILCGYTATSALYLKAVGRLANWYKVMIVNNVGHGGTSHLPRNHTRISSMAEVTWELTRQLGVKRCIVAGHSMGGQIGAYLAAEHPELVIELILCNSITGEHWDEQIERIRPYARQFAEGTLLQRTAVFPRLVAEISPLLRGLAGDSATMVRNAQRAPDSSLLNVGRSIYLRYLLKPQTLLPAGLAILTADPTVPVLDRIKVPVVVLHGAADPIVSLRDALSSHEHVSGSRLIVVEPSSPLEKEQAVASGHSWLLEASTTLYGIMDESLRGPLGELLRREVVSLGLDPSTATPATIEQSGTFYELNASILGMTPPWALRKAGKPHNPATWRHHAAA